MKKLLVIQIEHIFNPEDDTADFISEAVCEAMEALRQSAVARVVGSYTTEPTDEWHAKAVREIEVPAKTRIAVDR